MRRLPRPMSTATERNLGPSIDRLMLAVPTGVEPASPWRHRRGGSRGLSRPIRRGRRLSTPKFGRDGCLDVLASGT